MTKKFSRYKFSGISELSIAWSPSSRAKPHITTCISISKNVEELLIIFFFGPFQFTIGRKIRKGVHDV